MFRIPTWVGILAQAKDNEFSQWSSKLKVDDTTFRTYSKPSGVALHVSSPNPKPHSFVLFKMLPAFFPLRPISLPIMR